MGKESERVQVACYRIKPFKPCRQDHPPFAQTIQRLHLSIIKHATGPYSYFKKAVNRILAPSVKTHLRKNKLGPYA